MNNENYKVLVNIVACVESGGQVYGNRNYAAYAGAYANTPGEHTCTLGYGQFYGDEAHELIQMIFDRDKNLFRSIDNGSIESMLPKNWVSIRWNPNSTQKSILIKLITTDVGKQCQDELFIKRLKLYVTRAENFGVKSIKAQMMWAEIQHLGGVKPTERIFNRCVGNYSLDNIMNALKADQRDSSSNNQVGDKLYWSRHVKCREYIEKYAKEEVPIQMGYDVNKVIEVATAELGYCEKKSNSNLDSKTGNAGSGNYTKYWRDLYPSYQAQPWCDCFVDWCFMKAYGVEAAKKLECGGYKEFYTPTSAQYYKNKGRWSKTPKVGSQIFFKNSSRIHHTGLVVGVTSSTVITIEGNTNNGTAVVANGGMVCKKSYSRSNSAIAGYGHPDYGTSVESNPEPTVSKSYLSKGDTGSEVKKLQTNLNTVMKSGLKVDGDFGSLTETALKDFQTKYGLEVDGKYGPKSKAKLESLVKSESTVSNLSKGDTGSEVKKLQTNLNKVICAELEVDGSFGALTDTALRAFQSTYELEVDGVYGPNSRTKLESLVKAGVTFYKYGTVTAGLLNVRTGPSIKYQNLDAYPRLRQGNEVDVLYMYKGWSKVKISSKFIGYVSSEYLKLH